MEAVPVAADGDEERTLWESAMRHHHPDHSERLRDEEGAGLVEYALLLALIAVVVFGSVSFFGSETGGGFGKSGSCIKAAYEANITTECD